MLGFLLSLAGTFWLQGAIAEAVADVRDGRADLSVGDTLKKVSPFIARLAGAGLLAALGIIGGFILLIVPGLILLTWWVLITPVIVLENRAPSRRSAAAASSCAATAGTSTGTIVIGIAIGIAASIVTSIALVWLPSDLQRFGSNLISNTVIGPFIAAAWTLMYFHLRGEPEPAATPDPALPGPTPGT